MHPDPLQRLDLLNCWKMRLLPCALPRPHGSEQNACAVRLWIFLSIGKKCTQLFVIYLRKCTIFHRSNHLVTFDTEI
jgi:hypothetical protein